MECNKEEAISSMDIAEKKLLKNDYVGAKKFINKAQNLYPELDGLKQVLMIIDVFISASSGEGGGESDWYGILGVDPLADDETVKKQYKKLALLLHPDKNKFNGAEEAFKHVLNAWCLLSDKAKRSAYDRKRKEVTQKRKPHEPASSKTSASNDSAKAASSTTSESNDRTKAAREAAKEEQERWNRWFEAFFKKPMRTTTTNSTSEAERVSKKPRTSGYANSTSEAERVSKKPRTSGYANSTSEAERVSKKPRTSGYANSTYGAQRFFKKADTFIYVE